MTRETQIRAAYRLLYRAWGPQHWWPARTRFEVIVGAFLTQNTSWTNVERAMAQLRAAGVLSVDGIRRTPQPRLEQLVRSAGYFRQKAQRLKTFVAYLDQHYAGSLTRMLARPTQELRQELLALNGVGPETADSILLYAGNHPVFVVDAYTRRILDRHGILPATAPYDEIRTLFERALGVEPSPATVPQQTSRSGAAHSPSPVSRMSRSLRAQVFNDMHGLIVGLGKTYCLKAVAQCRGCPLEPLLASTYRPR